MGCTRTDRVLQLPTMAKSKSPQPSVKPAGTKHPGGRPKGAVPPPPVTGFRIPEDLMTDVDRLVEQLTAGAVRASRTTVVVDALREYVARHLKTDAS